MSFSESRAWARVVLWPMGVALLAISLATPVVSQTVFERWLPCRVIGCCPARWPAGRFLCDVHVTGKPAVVAAVGRIVFARTVLIFVLAFIGWRTASTLHRGRPPQLRGKRRRRKSLFFIFVGWRSRAGHHRLHGVMYASFGAARALATECRPGRIDPAWTLNRLWFRCGSKTLLRLAVFTLSARRKRRRGHSVTAPMPWPQPRCLSGLRLAAIAAGEVHGFTSPQGVGGSSRQR